MQVSDDDMTKTTKMQDKRQLFERLFRTEYDRMYRAAYLLLHDDEEARDAVQDVMERLWESSMDLREVTGSQFLLVCIRNQCLNVMREASRTPARLLPTEEGAETEEALLLDEIHAYIDQRLTPQTGRVVRMHYDEGMTYRDISRQLGISVGAVNKHIVQGLRKLRQRFVSK